MIKVIAFDADDTLWHNEPIFVFAKEKYKSLLSEYTDAGIIEQRLDEAETRNILHFGYGIKGFTLSMIETACELTEGRITGQEIQKIINPGREMLASPIEILEGVRETIEELAEDFDLMIITKGDLFDQESKLALSGLGNFFKRVEVVSGKDKKSYESIAAKYEINPQEFLMVGNSLRSDILPVLEIGAKAVHIPYETEWAHEKVEEDELEGKDFARLDKIALLSGWLKEYQ